MARWHGSRLKGSDLKMVLSRDLSSVARWLGSISAHQKIYIPQMVFSSFFFLFFLFFFLNFQIRNLNFFFNIANKIKMYTKENKMTLFFFNFLNFEIRFVFFKLKKKSKIKRIGSGRRSGTRVKPRVNDRVGLTWQVATDRGRVNRLVARVITARNVGGAWRHVHRWISSIFAA